MRIAFKSIEVDRWRDLRGAVLGDFGPGLNVVFAGNGRGKSTFALALAAALGRPLPDMGKDSEFRVQFWEGDRLVSSTLKAKQPGVVALEQSPSIYLMELLDLMSGQVDKAAADWLQGRVGSLNLAPRVKDFAFRRSRASVEDAIQLAARDRETLERLAQAEEGLAPLKNQLASARRAETDRSKLEDWRERLDLERDLAARLEAIQIAESEEPRSAKWSPGATESLAEALREAAGRRDQADRAREGCESWMGTYQPLSAWEFSRLRGLAEEEREANRDIKDARAEAAEAQKVVDSLQGSLAALGEDPPQDLTEVAKWEQWQRALLEHESETTKKDALLRAAAQVEPGSSPTPVVRVLDWIKAEPAMGADWRPWLLGALAVAGAGSGLLDLPLAARVVVLAVVGGGVLLVILLLRPRLDDSIRRTLEGELGAMTPDRAAELLREAAEAEGKTKARAHLDSKSDINVPEPSVPEWMKGSRQTVVTAGRILAELAAAEAERDGKLAKVRSREECLQRILSESEELAAKTGINWEDRSLQGIVDDLASWDGKLKSLKLALRELQDAETRVGREIERCGLDPDTPWLEAESEARLVQEARSRIEGLRSDADSIRIKISALRVSREDAEALLGGLFPDPDDEGAVARRIEELRADSDRVASLEEEVKRIEGEILVASQGAGSVPSDLAKALEEHRRNAEKAAESEIRELLASRWRALAREELSPAVVASARERLLRISRQRYRLDMVETGDHALGGVVAVYDNFRGGARYNLAQLSSGAKVHVALAVRLAVIEDMEKGSNKVAPLILDEVQAVSDPEARAEIAFALKIIAQERQVILFTNQPEEVALFGVEPIRFPNDQTSAIPVVFEPLRPELAPDPVLCLDRRISLSAQPLISEMVADTGLTDAVEAILEEMKTSVPPLTRESFIGPGGRPKEWQERAVELAAQAGGRHSVFRQHASSFNKTQWRELAAVHVDLPTLEEIRARLQVLAPPKARARDVDWAARLIHDSL